MRLRGLSIGSLNKVVYFLVERPDLPFRARFRREDSETIRPDLVWEASLPRPLAVFTIPFFLRHLARSAAVLLRLRFLALSGASDP